MAEYGELIARLVYADYRLQAPMWHLGDPHILVVDRADPVVSASAEMIKMCTDMISVDTVMVGSWASGFTEENRRVLRVGTEGHGLGVVRYEIREHPEGPEFVELHRIGD